MFNYIKAYLTTSREFQLTKQKQKLSHLGAPAKPAYAMPYAMVGLPTATWSAFFLLFGSSVYTCLDLLCRSMFL